MNRCGTFYVVTEKTKEEQQIMLDTRRIGTYALTIDEQGVTLASAGSGTISLTHADALALADYIHEHRSELETMQKQHAGETIAPPATEPE